MSRAALFTKTNIIGGVLLVLLLAVPSGVMLMSRSPDEAKKSRQDTLATVDTETQQKKNESVSYQGEEGKTALELLKAQTDVQTEASDFGELVTSINGTDGGGKKYWTFYVNGEMASVGAGDYITKDGENIEWKLQ